MSVCVIYSTTARASGGRTGRAGTTDGAFQATMTLPRELGGTGGEGVNPEQLFATGYAACFLGVMTSMTSVDGPAIPPDASVSVTVGVGPRIDGCGFGLDISLVIALPHMPRDKAKELVAKANESCPFSNALRNNVDIRLTIA